jgi:hypothetical protein
MKARVAVVLVVCLCLSVSVQAVVISMVQDQMPNNPGGIYSFKMAVLDAQGSSASAFQSSLSVAGPGTLTLNVAESVAVAQNSNYWLFGNSDGAEALDKSGQFEFGDNSHDGMSRMLMINDIVGKYAFAWDGTQGWYTFTFNLDLAHSFIVDDQFANQPLSFESGNTAFEVFIPEPATCLLMGLGIFAVKRSRR